MVARTEMAAIFPLPTGNLIILSFLYLRRVEIEYIMNKHGPLAPFFFKGTRNSQGIAVGWRKHYVGDRNDPDQSSRVG